MIVLLQAPVGWVACHFTRNTWRIENFYSHSLLRYGYFIIIYDIDCFIFVFTSIICFIITIFLLVLVLFIIIIIRYCPKRLGFSFDGYTMRNQLAVLDHNEHVGRGVATTKDGEPMISSTFSRRTKEWVAYRILRNKSYSYIHGVWTCFALLYWPANWISYRFIHVSIVVVSNTLSLQHRYIITELMAECLRERYITPAYNQPSSERSQALKRKAPNLSNQQNPGTAGISSKKMQRCQSGTDKVIVYYVWSLSCCPVAKYKSVSLNA